MSCCPDGAWNNLNNKEYKPKGTIDRVDATEIDVYRVENSKKCLIWNYTIFRFDGGRVKQMADFFADHGTSLYGLIYSHTYLYYYTPCRFQLRRILIGLTFRLSCV